MALSSRKYGFGALLSVFLFTALASLEAKASLWSQYGYGAHNMGLANSTVALPTDVFSQAYNPALMVFDKKIRMAVGLEGAVTQFKSINNVLVDTPALGGSTNQYSDVWVKTPDIFSLLLGMHVPLSSKSERPWHFGATLSSPVERLFFLDTQDAYLPQYVPYLSDGQKLTTGFSIAKALSDSFAFGVGVNVFIVQGATARTRLPAGGNSTSRMKMDVKPALAPTAGVVWTANPEAANDESKFRLALSYFGKQDSTSQIEFNNTITILNGPSDLIIYDKSTLYYDPETIMLGWSLDSSSSSFSMSAHWERWSGFKGTAMALTFTNYSTLRQVLPAMNYVDIVSTHVGYQKKWENTALRFGLGYTPTPVPDQSGEANILDSDKYQLHAGLGRKFNPEFLDNPLQLDLAGFWYKLKDKTVTKNSTQFIGAPGYDIGGNIYGYSLTATVEF